MLTETTNNVSFSKTESLISNANTIAIATIRTLQFLNVLDLIINLPPLFLLNILTLSQSRKMQVPFEISSTVRVIL